MQKKDIFFSKHNRNKRNLPKKLADAPNEINITVEEKPTGEIFAGAGTGTSGSTVSGGIKEKNFSHIKDLNVSGVALLSDKKKAGTYVPAFFKK